MYHNVVYWRNSDCHSSRSGISAYELQLFGVLRGMSCSFDLYDVTKYINVTVILTSIILG